VQRTFQIKKNIAFASSHQRRDGSENVVKPPVSERYYDKRYGQRSGLAQKSLHILYADASRLAAVAKTRNISIFQRFRALPDGRLNA